MLNTNLSVDSAEVADLLEFVQRTIPRYLDGMNPNDLIEFDGSRGRSELTLQMIPTRALYRLAIEAFKQKLNH